MPRAYLVRVNSRGLHHDADLLADRLREQGYEVLHLTHPFTWKLTCLTWSAEVTPKPQRGDVVIFLENVCPLRDIVKSEARLVLIPNAELLSETHVQWANCFCDDVWHKCQLSKDVYDSWSFSNQTVPRHTMLGFTSRDLYLPHVRKVWKSKFLHLFGTSPAKGTTDLIKMWLKHPEWPTLVLVGTAAGTMAAQPAPNIQFRTHVDEKDHPEWMNEHGIHICPSAAEGWGHYIVEAMGCGSVVLTTHAPPMSEHVTDGETGFLLPLKTNYPYRDFARTVINDDRGNNMARWNMISQEGLEGVMERVLSMTDEELEAVGRRARAWFLANHQRFQERLRSTLPSVVQTANVTLQGVQALRI